mmetsp:Transcript_68198/g.113371  ORF Transcript_68198/g.113371 Transcript_68198/m.113371 type:complete len:85 (-) Transcript_68198:521-775(-)
MSMLRSSYGLVAERRKMARKQQHIPSTPRLLRIRRLDFDILTFTNVILLSSAGVEESECCPFGDSFTAMLRYSLLQYHALLHMA